MTIFQKAILRTTGQKVKILPRIKDKEIQPTEYERICIPEGDILHIVLALRSSLKFPNDDGAPTGPKGSAGSLDRILKVACG